VLATVGSSAPPAGLARAGGVLPAPVLVIQTVPHARQGNCQLHQLVGAAVGIPVIVSRLQGAPPDVGQELAQVCCGDNWGGRTALGLRYFCDSYLRVANTPGSAGSAMVVAAVAAMVALAATGEHQLWAELGSGVMEGFLQAM
jgi:hypothetical protein